MKPSDERIVSAVDVYAHDGAGRKTRPAGTNQSPPHVLVFDVEKLNIDSVEKAGSEPRSGRPSGCEERRLTPTEIFWSDGGNTGAALTADTAHAKGRRRIREGTAST